MPSDREMIQGTLLARQACNAMGEAYCEFRAALIV